MSLSQKPFLGIYYAFGVIALLATPLIWLYQIVLFSPHGAPQLENLILGHLAVAVVLLTAVGFAIKRLRKWLFIPAIVYGLVNAAYVIGWLDQGFV